MHGGINRRFAGTKKIQDDGILAGEIGLKFIFMTGLFLLDASQTTLGHHNLIEHDIIRHSFVFLFISHSFPSAYPQPVRIPGVFSQVFSASG